MNEVLNILNDTIKAYKESVADRDRIIANISKAINKDIYIKQDGSVELKDVPQNEEEKKDGKASKK